VAVAGNRGGAGGARNLARVERVRRKPSPAPPPPIPAARRPVAPSPAVRERHEAIAVQRVQRVSQRKRAKRVELSAQRKRIGYDQPILVKRRQRVRQQADLAAALDAITRPKPEPAPKGLSKRQAVMRQNIARASVGDITGQVAPLDYGKAISNIPKDALEMAVTMPSSVAKLASTAATHPQRVPGLLWQPYHELIKNPKGFIEEHPVSAALMFAPTVKVPGRIAGRVARVTGRQSLELAPATVPGSPLRMARTAPRDLIGGKLAARRERGAAAPRMTDKQIRRRVDEFYDYARQRRPDVVKSARKQAQQRGYDAEKTATHVQGAVSGDMAREFRKEFGENPPEVATKRLFKHMVVGSSPAVGAKVRRIGGRSFRSAVLPLSLKWLTGQAVEPAVRSALTGVGPTSLLREAKVYRALERERPGAGKEFRMRTSGGGQFGLTGTAREFAEGRSLAQEFPENRFAAGVSKAAAAPGIRHIRQGWHGYSNFVFNGVNGVIERTARRAMTGKAIATGPLMERRLLTLSDAAIEDAARGLRGTENQYALGRAVDDLYGRYQKFSPNTREQLLYMSPFAPWYANSVNFLFRVLPRDHPVSTALLANISALEEDWRKQHGLSLRGGKEHPARPAFLLGGYPTKSGGIVRLGRYTPALPADVAGAVSDLVYPQFRAPVENLAGIDWTGQRLRKKEGGKQREYTQVERALEAAKSAAEAHVPGAGQVGRAIERKGSLPRRLRAEVDPFMATGKPPTVRRKRRRVRRKLPLGFGAVHGGAKLPLDGGGYPGFGALR